MNQDQKLSAIERGVSASLAVLLWAIAARRTHPLLRATAAIGGLGLLARAFMGAPIKPARRAHSPASTSAIDDSIEGTFPASDPPASRLPDEPPSNADDKWEAARAAGKEPG